MAEITFVQEDDISFSTFDIYHHDLFEHQSNPIEEDTTSFSLDLELGLGFCVESTNLDDDDDHHEALNDYGFGFSSADCGDDFFSSNGFGSDFDDGVENALGIDFGLGFGGENGGENGEDLGWEEVDGLVDGLVDERELMDDDVDFSVAMEEDLGVERVSNLEWEMLLNVHNLDPNVDDEFEMLAGQFAWEEGRNLPASRLAVENLDLVVVTKNDVEGDNATCAVCKDDMVVGEKAKSLPCLHRYHGPCIDPWLGMRNTCPVCRYELPTDDLEYERRRRERGLRR